MRQWLATLVLLGAMSGCALEVELDEPVEQAQVPPSTGATPIDELRSEHLHPLDDPCACETQACVDAWAEDHLGCNVCVSLVCDDTPSTHACHFCDG